MVEKILHRILSIELPVHDFLHACIGSINQNLVIHVSAEKSLFHTRFEKAETVVTFLGTHLLQELQYTGHPVDFFIENHSHHLVQLHLLAIYIADDVYHIARFRLSKMLHILLHLLMPHFHAGNQQVLLVAEDFINRAFRHMKCHGNFVHLHSLHPTPIKLGHGKSDNLIAQIRSILFVFYHFYIF